MRGHGGCEDGSVPRPLCAGAAAEAVRAARRRAHRPRPRPRPGHHVRGLRAAVRTTGNNEPGDPSSRPSENYTYSYIAR